nr:reverse transcriptase domain-containing protein [Tanacetum cinerariifolium]
MSTHSSARNLFPPLDNPELTIRRRSRVDPTLLNDFEMATKKNNDPPVLDLRTMEELCQPTFNGWGGPIAQIAIQATNFGLKNDMIQQYQVNGVTDDALRLYLFPHSLTHHATAWFDRLPRNSINTFEQRAKMFLGKYFPPSMVTKLRNEITNFRQRPDASLFEAWNQGNNHGIPQGNNQGRNQFFQGASHGQNPPPAYQAPAYQASGHQAPIHQPLIPQLQVVTTTEFTNYMKANDAILKNMQTNMTSLTNSDLELKNMFGQFMKMNITSSLGLGTLLSNTVTNPKEDLKGITTRSGTAYQGPTIPTTSSSLPKVVERETDVTNDTVPHTNNESTKDVLPLAVQIETPKPKSESVVAPTERALIDVYAGELTLRVNNEAMTFNIDQTSRYAANYNDMTANRIDVIDMDCEDDFLLEEVDAFLDLEDDPTLPEVDHSYYDTEGDIILFEAFLNDDPSLPPPNQGMYLP